MLGINYGTKGNEHCLSWEVIAERLGTRSHLSDDQYTRLVMARQRDTVMATQVGCMYVCPWSPVKSSFPIYESIDTTGQCVLDACTACRLSEHRTSYTQTRLGLWPDTIISYMGSTLGGTQVIGLWIADVILARSKQGMMLDAGRKHITC